MIEVNGTILIQFVNFFLLMAVLHFVLFRPLRALMQRRREMAEGAHDKARSLEGQIEEKMARYQERLQEAKLKASQERAALRAAAAQQEAQILGEAREKASAQVQSMVERIAGEADQARQSLQQETRAMASQIAGRLLGREI